MSLDKENLYNLLKIAIEAAKKAGLYIKENQFESHTVEIKNSDLSKRASVVTKIDLESQNIIISNLKESMINYELGLLSEEILDDKSRFQNDYFWCIDPLDGTYNYIRGEYGHSVSIGLVSKEGKSVLGVVYNPVTEDIYTAIKDQGAYKNHKVIKCSLQTTNYDVIVNEPYGAVLNAIHTIEESPAIYYKKPKTTLGGGSVWDYAATSIIIEQAGGIACDFNLKPLKLNPNESTFMNKNGIIYSSSNEILKAVNLI